MPISVAGQTLGVVPAFSGRTTVRYFDDFVAGNPVNTANFPPQEWSGNVATPVWFFDDPADGQHIGAIAQDMSLSGGANVGQLTPIVQLNCYSRVEWETEFLFSGFDTTGGRNQAILIGMGNEGDGCAPLNFIGFVAASSSVGTCGVAYPSNNTLHAYGAQGAFAAANFFGSVPIGDVTGVWTKLRMIYERSFPRVQYYINGVLLGTNSDAARIPDALTTPFMFNNGVSRSGVGAPTMSLRFDYVSFVGTVSR
jgi:hypothetical protein